MDDRVGSPGDRFEGPLYELGPALDENLDGHVVGDAVLFDDLADELEVWQRRSGKPDLDLLEAHANEGLEEPELAGRIHRVDEGLVTVAQIDAAPSRCLCQLPVGPGPIGELEGTEGRVLLEGHVTGSRIVVAGHWDLSVRDGAGTEKTSRPVGTGGCGEHRYVVLAYIRRRSPLRISEGMTGRC